MVIIDPISNLHYAGTLLQVEAFMMRLIDLFKTQQISTIMTNLTSGGSALEQTEVGISSLADTWLLLRDQETNGERNRLLYVLKSRGMNHSNQVREFRLTPNGIQLLDVYLGTGGVLTGTARLIQEAQEKAKALAQQQEIDRKQRELKRKRALIDAQIAALQAEFEAEQEEIERTIAQEYRREQIQLQDQRDRAQLRQADHEAEAE
jgi:circadian clock protein KaiC